MDIIEVAELAILLTARIDDLSKKMDLAKSRVTNLQKHTTTASNLMHKSWLRVAGGLAALGVSVYGAIAAVRHMVSVNVSFNKSMTDVLSKTQASSQEMERMEAIARRMGATTIFSASQAADAMSGLATMGLKTADDMNNVLEPALNLAAATNITIEQSSEQVVKAIKAFRLEMTDAARVANVLTAAHVNSTATVDVLREAFKYAGPVAGELGQSIEDVAAVSANFTNIGLEASQAGTAYRMAMTKLTKAFKENGEASGESGKILAEHGFTQEKITALLPKPVALLKELAKANLTTGEAIRVYGTRAAFAFNGMVALSDQIEKLRDTITGTNAAQEIATIQLTSIWGKARIVKSVYEELVLTLGDRLIPFIKTFLDLLAKSITEFTKNKRNIDLLIGAFGIFVTVLVRAGQILANVGSIIKFLSTGFSILHRVILENVLPVFGKYGKSLTTDLINPTLAFSKIIINNVLPALQQLHKHMAKEEWDTTAVEQLKDAYRNMSNELVTNGVNADKLIDSLSKVGKAGSFFDNVVKAQKRFKELTESNVEAFNQAKSSMIKAEMDIYLKTLELEGKKSEAFRFRLDQEIQELEQAGAKKTSIEAYELAATMAFRKDLIKDQISSIKNLEEYEKSSTSNKISMIRGILEAHQASLHTELKSLKDAGASKEELEKVSIEKSKEFALSRLAIEENLQELIKQKNKETYDTIAGIMEGPLSDSMTSFFKSFYDDTIDMGQVWKKLWQDMVNNALSMITKLLASSAIKALVGLLTGGTGGGIVGTIGKLFGFEKGGIVSYANGGYGIANRPQLAVYGDTPNHSPEVFAPLDKLQDMIKPRVAEAGASAAAASSTTTTNVTIPFTYAPTYGFGTPAEIRKAGQELLKVLQDAGLSNLINKGR